MGGGLRTALGVVLDLLRFMACLEFGGLVDGSVLWRVELVHVAPARVVGQVFVGSDHEHATAAPAETHSQAVCMPAYGVELAGGMGAGGQPPERDMAGPQTTGEIGELKHRLRASFRNRARD